MWHRRAWWRPSISDIPQDQLIKLKAIDEPVGKSWLSRSFANLIEEEVDQKKLTRAKKCLENGAGCRIRVKPGNFTIGICCSGYVIRQVTFWFKMLTESQRDRIIGLIASDTALIGSVLSGEISEFFLNRLEAKKIMILPGKFNEITPFCNCREGNVPCIHIISAWLILSEDLDENPWHIFTLRGITHKEIVTRVKASRDYRALLSDSKNCSSDKKMSGEYLDIPDSHNPVGFFSIVKGREALPEISDDDLEIDPMILLGKAPYSLGGKNMSDRIGNLYPIIKNYANSLIKQEVLTEKKGKF
jgi:uncharacterized Zn finger protein